MSLFNRAQICSCLVASVLMGATTGFAQTVQIPSSADPSRQNEQKSSYEKLESLQLKAKTKSAVPSAQIPEDIARQTFVLTDLEFEGMKAFLPEDLEPVYQKDLGKTITIRRLFEILTAAQKKYYDNGYALSYVYLPEQDTKTGHIVIRVVEGYVSAVDFDEGLDIDSPLLRAFESDILAMRPLNTIRLERLMLILNDRSGLNLSSIISSFDKGTGNEGGVRLTLKKQEDVDKKGYVRIDNYGSNFSGPVEFSSGYLFDKGLYNYSNAAFSMVQTASNQELKQGRVAVSVPIWGVSGTTVNFSGSKTLTVPGDSLDILDIKGDSTNLQASLSYPVIRQRDQSLYVTGGFDYKDVKTDILDDRLSEDRLRSIFLEAQYSFSDEWAGLNSIRAKYGHGLDFFGSRPSGSIDLSRLEGRSDFRKIEMSYVRQQPLTDHIDVMGSLYGQHTPDPLLSAEEFGFGGSSLGRGYDSSEIAGDRGVSGSLELRYKDNITMAHMDGFYTVYAFYDAGKIWNIDSASKNQLSAASAGVGAQLYLQNGISLELLAAKPLTKTVENHPGYANGASPRYLFALQYRF